jgi:large subunit ribosomal protein L13
MKTMKTYTTKPSHVESGWLVFDAADKILGRLATEVSGLLQGKHKPIYARNILTGDHIIVVNASRIKVTGNKLEEKLYRRHSHYPGGLRETTMARMKENHPDRIFRAAVKGMLPKTILGRQMLSRLKIYAGDVHPHGAPVKELASEVIRVVPLETERPVLADIKVSEQPLEAVLEKTTEVEEYAENKVEN